MAHSLQTLHTFALTSQCQQFVKINNLEQLKTQNFKPPFCLLGEGSNTVFLNDYTGTVIKMATQGVQIKERANDYLISVAAGENWHQLVSELLAKNIPGLENLALIPGTVGAAPVQNIGAYGVELAKFVFLFFLLRLRGRFSCWCRCRLSRFPVRRVVPNSRSQHTTRGS